MISVKFSLDVNGWQRYQMVWKHCGKLSTAHERYRQTDGQATAYSEREREKVNEIQNLNSKKLYKIQY